MCNNNLGRITTLVIISFFLALPTVSIAQVLEEIIVTARKREESLQDIPISVQAFSGGQIAEQNIIDIESLAPYTPSFQYSQSPGASDIYFMRGLGTFGSGAHFEPGVGQVFNGFFSTRGRLGRSALVDVAQIEVLKGPQGSIIGKNTSLGAINITSNKPTDEFEARLTAQYNILASDGFDVTAVVSGPFTDRVRGRAVVNYRDVDGWMEDPAGNDVQSAEDLTIRTLLDVDITDNVMVELLYQRTDFDREGKGRTSNGCLDLDPGVVAGVPIAPGGRPGPPGGLFSIAGATALGIDCASGATDVTVSKDIHRASPSSAPFDSKEPNTISNNMFGVTITADLENVAVTALLNWFEYEITDQFSGDQTSSTGRIGCCATTPSPGERISIENAEDYKQFYGELRINSTTGLFDGALDYTAGFMFFSGEMEIFQGFNSVAGAIGPVTGNPPVTAAGPPFAVGTPLTPISRNEFAGSDTDSQAIFGEVEYHVNEQLTLTLGTRVTHETRSGFKSQAVGVAYTGELLPALCNFPAIPLAACIPELTGDLSETNISYNASLTYQFNDDHTLYFTNATGFKSGGFDLRGAGNAAKFVFPKEQTEHFEIGGKHTFLDGSVRFNWAVFHTEVQDLQTAANDPVIISQIVAAADVTAEGVELDLAWSPIDNFIFTFTGTYANTEYDKFLGSCYTSQAEAGTGCTNLAFSTGLLTGVQDLKGKQAVFAPEWSSVVGGEYTLPMGGNMELTASVKWINLGGFFTAVERDPLSFQPSSDRIDASLVLAGTLAGGNPWTVGLIGKNLTDEFILNFSNASTLSGQASVNTSIQQTRFIALRTTIGW